MLDRLTSAVLPNLPLPTNRLSSITAQAGATRSFTFDANGSTVNDGINQYVYATRGRLARALAKWLLGAAVAGALLGAGAAQAQSAGTVVAGPFTVTLPSTQLFSFSQNFGVPAPIQGSYVLRVGLSAANSLTSLSVKLNNVQLLALSDFAGGVASVDKVVTLLASDTLALQAAGATGTKITVTAFTVVMPKPVSLLPSPLGVTGGRATGTLTAMLSPTPTAAGTLNLTSANHAVATVPGTVAFAAGQSAVPVPVTGIASGSITITAAANGGQATATVNVNAPPTVSLTAPANNSVFQAPATITITASASDADGTVTKVDFFQGTALIATVSIAPYSVTLANVAAGSYSFTAVATDNQGTTTTSTAVTVKVNPPPPVIFGQTPKDVTLPGGSTPEVGAAYTTQGSDIDVTTVRLQFDGRDVTSQATVTGTGTVYQAAPLADATHTVTLTVGNLAGGSTTQTWSFVVDDPAPNFYSETPRDVVLAVTNPRVRVLLSGFNIVPSSIRIALDGSDVTAQAGVAIDHIVFIPASPLTEGIHAVSVVATDARGVTAGMQWSFTVALPPPPSTTADGVRADRTVTPQIRALP